MSVLASLQRSYPGWVLTVSGLSKAHGPRTLFSDVTLQLSAGRRVALIGGNGVGKTTLIESIMGVQDPDGGVIHKPKDLQIGYLAQELPEATDRSVLAETCLLYTSPSPRD